MTRYIGLFFFGVHLVFAVAATAKPLKVVTTFTVLADMAQNVAGDKAEVVSITKPGAEIHTYQPTPRDLFQVRDADLILWNGLNLEAWFAQFFARLRDVPAVTLTDGITPIALSGGGYEGAPNPHAWMAQGSADIYIDNIVAALSQLAPVHSAEFQANAAAYKAEIAAIMTPIKQALSTVPESQRWLVSCEGAFSYLARDLALKELYLWPMNADQTGRPQDVRRVIDTVKQHQIPAVFCESTLSSDPALQVARETGARFGGILYVDSLSAADGPVPTYLDLLRVTSETILSGLKGEKP